MHLRILLFLLFFQISNSAKSQVDPQTIYKDFKNIRIGNKSAKEIAQKLTKEYSDDLSKYYAISFWIIRKIRYDFKLYASRGNNPKTVKQTLKTKKGVCGDFSNLLKEMCNAVGIPCETIYGYTKEVDFMKNDSLFRAEHAWSIVKLNNEWQLTDITWANGGVKVKRKPIRWLLWKAFQIPYSRKLYYSEKLTNFKWLRPKPMFFATSHLPILNEFQLLSPTVPIDSFTIGGSAVFNFFTEKKVKEIQHPKVDSFQKKSFYERWEEYKNQSLKNNPRNHRISAVSGILLADTLCRKYINKSSGTLNCDSKELKRIEDLLMEAKKHLAETKSETKREFIIKKTRNKGWKSNVKKTNKQISKEINSRIKLNKIEIKQFKKSKKERKTLRKKLKKNQKIIAKYKIRYNRTKRPKQKKSNKKSGQKFIKVADSLWQLQITKKKEIDSLIKPFKLDTFNAHYAFEKKNKRIHRINKKSIKNITKNPGLRPWWYFNDFYTEKEWFKLNHNKADSLNKRYSKLLTNKNENTLKQLKRKIKTYNKHQNYVFKTLKKAKKSHFNNQGENEKNKEIQNSYSQSLLKIREDLTEHLKLKKNLLFSLKIQNKILKKSKRRIKLDNKVENYRHTKYQKYRVMIKKAEDNRVKILKNDIKNLQKLVENTKKKVS